MTSLERRYRRWMLTYPEAYRRQHESEILGTLLEGASVGQRWPSAREVAALLAGGLRTRARLAATSPGRLTADGLRLGALLCLAMQCGTFLGVALSPIVMGAGAGQLAMPALVYLDTAALGLAAVALARGRLVLALAGIAGIVAVEVAERFARPIPAVPIGLVSVAWLVVGAVVAILVWHPSLRPFRGRPTAPLTTVALAAIALEALWFLAVAAAYRYDPALAFPMFIVSPPLLVPAIALAALALVGQDPRPALAATVLMATTVLSRLQAIAAFSSDQNFPQTGYVLATLLSVLVLAAAAAVAVRGARRLAGG